MDRPRDGAEVLAEDLLARILVKAARMGLVPPAKPTGKKPATNKPTPLCETEREFRARKRRIQQQAEELSLDSKAS